VKGEKWAAKTGIIPRAADGDGRSGPGTVDLLELFIRILAGTVEGGGEACGAFLGEMSGAVRRFSGRAKRSKTIVRYQQKT
jgi:hypothetical protein